MSLKRRFLNDVFGVLFIFLLFCFCFLFCFFCSVCLFALFAMDSVSWYFQNAATSQKRQLQVCIRVGDGLKPET